MISSTGYAGHSAKVEMHLIVNDCVLAIAQMGHDFLLLEAPADHPPGPASLFLQVDESKSQWAIFLPDGVSADSTRVTIAEAKQPVASNASF